MRVLIVRPQPAADATAARVAAIGHDPVVCPLLATQPLDWVLPATLPEAVMLTSAAAVRHAGPLADALKYLPAYCVGSATAAAARAAGWPGAGIAQAGAGTAQALLDMAAGGPHRRLLHLAGEDRTDAVVPPGLIVDVVMVYRAALQPLQPPTDAQAVLLHSPRTARQLAAEWDRLGQDRCLLRLHAISAATAAAAGPGWQAVHIAAQPDEDALLATLAKAG